MTTATIDKETLLLICLRDDQLRNVVLHTLSPRMFESRTAKATYYVLKDLGGSPTENVLEAHLLNHLNEDETQTVMDYWRKQSVALKDGERKTVLSKLQSFVKSRMFQDVVTNVINDGGRISEPNLKKLNEISEMKFSDDQFLDFSQLKVVERVKQDEQTSGKLIKSSFSVINRSLLYGGYRTGQVVMVAGAPGIGKSTLMIAEAAQALKNKCKVLHFFLGDLEAIDVLCRYIANILNENITNVVIDPTKYHAQMKSYFERLRIGCYPAGEISAEELRQKCRIMKDNFDFDVVIVDYDSNLRISGDSLYLEGGSTYGILDAIAKTLNCLVFVGSQTKINWWGAEIIPKEAAGESSRKQHTVDVMIGLGRNPDVRRVGTIHMAKARRGDEGTKIRVKLAYENSRIEEMSQADYETLIKQFK